MELATKRIQTNEIGKMITDQFVVDDECNVPDAKQDVGRVLTAEGEISISEIKKVENYIRLTGKIFYCILYVTDSVNPELEVLKGQLPFEEMLYVEAEEGEDYLAKVTAIDVVAEIIHSRKLSLKAVVDFVVHKEQLNKEEITIDVECDKNFFKKKKPLELLQLQSSKRDIYRIKEEMLIPETKENIATLIWTDVNLRRMDTKVVKDAITFTGSLQVFAFYLSEEEKTDWVEQMVPFEGTIICNGAEEGYYHHIYQELNDVNVEIRMDSDGEMRILGIEGTLEMRVFIYREECVEILEDVYSLEKECVLDRKPVIYEELISQNHSKYKMCERVTIPELQEDVLQICHSSGWVQLETMKVQECGIQMEGFLHVKFLYVKANDRNPFGVWSGVLPFSYLLECAETSEQMRYDITVNIEQITMELSGSGVVEVKAILAFQGFFRQAIPMEMITQIQLQDVDMEERNSRPGLIGYVTKEGDSLWSLAKRYLTTEEHIREMNDIGDGEVGPGQKLLIFKENMSIL